MADGRARAVGCASAHAFADAMQGVVENRETHGEAALLQTCVEFAPGDAARHSRIDLLDQIGKLRGFGAVGAGCGRIEQVFDNGGEVSERHGQVCGESTQFDGAIKVLNSQKMHCE
jgi:hypothetical protein